MTTAASRTRRTSTERSRTAARIGPGAEDFMAISLGWATPSLQAIDQVQQGLALASLDSLERMLPGTVHRIVPKSTLAALRKHSDRLAPEQSDRLYRTGKVLGFAMTVYRDEDKVRSFMTRPHPMLGDRTPLAVAIESGAGADLVVNLLGRGAYGGGA